MVSLLILVLPVVPSLMKWPRALLEFDHRPPSTLSQTINFTDKTVIASPEHVCDRLFIIAVGTVHVVLPGDGPDEEFVVGRLRPGMHIGETCLEHYHHRLMMTKYEHALDGPSGSWDSVSMKFGDGPPRSWSRTYGANAIFRAVGNVEMEVLALNVYKSILDKYFPVSLKEEVTRTVHNREVMRQRFARVLGGANSYRKREETVLERVMHMR